MTYAPVGNRRSTLVGLPEPPRQPPTLPNRVGLTARRSPKRAWMGANGESRALDCRDRRSSGARRWLARRLESAATDFCSR